MRTLKRELLFTMLMAQLKCHEGRESMPDWFTGSCLALDSWGAVSEATCVIKISPCVCACVFMCVCVCVCVCVVCGGGGGRMGDVLCVWSFHSHFLQCCDHTSSQQCACTCIHSLQDYT